MIATTTELGIEGSVVCGQTLKPCDADSVYAIFKMENCVCGLTVEKGSKTPYLRLTPGIQLPREARDGFERFQFECDDEAMVDLTLDRGDGELVLRRDLRDAKPETVERALAPLLAWLDESGCPAVMDYIAGCYRDAE